MAEAEAEPSPSVAPALEKLTQDLLGAQDEIIGEWVRQVRADSEIQAADSLTRKQVEDHLPALLGDLIQRVGAVSHRGPDLTGAAKNAEAHGAQRWKEGYQLDELILELERFRDVVLRRVDRFKEAEPVAAEQAKSLARRRVLRWTDEISASSAEQFVREQNEALSNRVLEIQKGARELEGASEQLRELGESRLRLLRFVSHELRNALNSVELAATAVLEEQEPGDHAAVTNVLLRSVRDLHKLLDRLMDFSSMLSGKQVLDLEQVNLRELARELREMYQPMAQVRGLALHVDASGAMNPVYTDLLRLKQIVSNLVSNAIKYTSHGSVLIELGTRSDGTWYLRVRDTGMGIAPEDRENLFRELYRSERTAGIRGTGFGLAITHHLVTLLGGEISVISEVNSGTSFEATFSPQAEAAGN